jgi:hypothetical protein
MSSIPLTEAASTGSCSFSLARITCITLFPAFYNALYIWCTETYQASLRACQNLRCQIGFFRSKPGHPRVGMTKRGALHAPMPLKT